jgi:hypothetical protein
MKRFDSTYGLIEDGQSANYRSRVDHVEEVL